MSKLKIIGDRSESCPYCKGSGKIAPSPAVRIRLLREQFNMNQKEFADAVGIGRAQIANFETGRTNFSIDLLMRIADRFDVSVDWLLGRAE